ncbi:MAG: hypothetical protein IT281_06735 [Ignavibacteria bacterium]|nr:hypothetical protein [Ignavibacteria bacterium]MCC7159215.1 hypothetical protein [Ignavibacteria bacterium]
MPVFKSTATTQLLVRKKKKIKDKKDKNESESSRLRKKSIKKLLSNKTHK